MKPTKADVFWLIVIGLALFAIFTRLAMIAMSMTYDESRHRAEITKVYPSVEWPEYREAAREICALSDRKFDLVVAMAYQDGPEAIKAFAINTRHMCPKRLKSVEK